MLIFGKINCPCWWTTDLPVCFPVKSTLGFTSYCHIVLLTTWQPVYSLLLLNTGFQTKLSRPQPYPKMDYWPTLVREQYIIHNALNFLRLVSGGSKGGCQGRAPPPLSQNFFIFMQFSGKIRQIVGWRPPLGLAHPLWEILDPPLIRSKYCLRVHKEHFKMLNHFRHMWGLNREGSSVHVSNSIKILWGPSATHEESLSLYS